MTAPTTPDYDLQRELLTSGIADTQGTIHANDSKCSAALITHGLIFAGLVTVSANAADLYPKADSILRVIAVVLASLVLLAFVVSIICLLRAVMPYRPKSLVKQIKSKHQPPGLFFPEIYGRDDPVQDQLATAASLDEQGATLDLVSESVKLAAIRLYESRWARRGYRALIAEVLIAAAYLGVVIAAALTAV